MNRRRAALIVIAVGLCMTGVLADSTEYDKSATPKILSKWSKSADGKVSICLAVNKTTFSPTESIVVRCALRNNTDKPLRILRPFGDSFYAFSSGLQLLGPDGMITYTGAMKEYMLGESAYCEVQPGMIVDETLEIPKEYFKGLGELGLYRIEYTYQSSDYYVDQKPENVWEGRIGTDVIYILVMDKKSGQPFEGARHSTGD